MRDREEYFERDSTYTLEPLRLNGPAALAVSGLEGIDQIVLRELELAWDNPLEGRTVRRAGDLFANLGPEQLETILPRHAIPARAVFDVLFTGAVRPRPVELRPPNVLKLGRHCDAQRVDGWLSRRGFRLHA